MCPNSNPNPSPHPSPSPNPSPHPNPNTSPSPNPKLTAVRREHAERVETLARLPQGWEEHWELSPNGEYSRYYLHVETGEVRRQPPQTDADDEYSCDLEGEMTIPEGEMYAELEVSP